jgi:branched-chain amino acid aminotransferase
MSILDPPVVPADDRGLLLGDGLFETVRLYRGRPFRLEAHLVRLEEGARRVGIPVPGELRARVSRALEDWGDGHGALRITLTRGGGAGPAGVAGLHGDGGGTPTLAVQVRGWHPDPIWYAEGLRAHRAGRVSAGALSAGLKSLAYLERIQALRVAREQGADEALLRNEAGDVMGGSASNVLAVVDDTVLAPGVREGALSGITRGVVLELLREGGFTVEETGISPEALAAASEILLTSSLREVVPVVKVDSDAVGSGRPGRMFRTALLGLRARVADELGLGPDELEAL